MVTMNSFDLLGDVDNEDPSQLLELLQQKIKSKKLSSVVPDADEVSAAAKFPSHAVKERREGYSGPRDRERGGTGRGRGGRGSGFGGRNSYSNENSDGYTPNDSELEKDSRNPFDREHGMRHGPGPYRPIRGGLNTWGDPFDGGNRDRRIRNRWGGSRKQYSHGNSATAHDQPEEKHEDLVAEMKEIISDEVEQIDAPASEAINDWEESKTNEEKEAETKKAEAAAKKAEEEAKKAEEEASKKAEEEAKKAEEEARRAEEEKMTLEEYEKVLEEKRKVLVAMKAEERKVELDKSFESMKLLKKGKEEIFVKLGSDKNSGKRREDGDREEKVKKSVSIIEFLKPAEGERRNYRSGGGRRDRGEGDRGATRGRGRGHNNNNARSSPDGPSIGDISLFPSLGGK
ncbi:RGG repeats nuclear RNA binding protein C-like isoform X2 [Papaver somniferum]|uniref:RGG repeats nuclear RNA binding protein C-like isoform X2 n=1 Tax=Papaver somniferum TaxID=3469 RepID=UPI000E6F9DDA|nr:RGG repeats nuclear RNA binding protein C-like isoform X2 [Papaver somniferum]